MVVHVANSNHRILPTVDLVRCINTYLPALPSADLWLIHFQK